MRAAGQPVVLAVHSGSGVSGYGATDRIPELIAHMVYVDSAPATGAINPGETAVEVPLPTWEEFAADGENLDGLTPELREAFTRRAVPEPGAAFREGPVLTNPARLDVPSTVICTGMTSQDYQDAIGKGWAWMGGLAELRNVSYVDLPTSHWPMFTRPRELAAILGDVARA